MHPPLGQTHGPALYRDDGARPPGGSCRGGGWGRGAAVRQPDGPGRTCPGLPLPGRGKPAVPANAQGAEVEHAHQTADMDRGRAVLRSAVSGAAPGRPSPSQGSAGRPAESLYQRPAGPVRAHDLPARMLGHGEHGGYAGHGQGGAQGAAALFGGYAADYRPDRSSVGVVFPLWRRSGGGRRRPRGHRTHAAGDHSRGHRYPPFSRAIPCRSC